MILGCPLYNEGLSKDDEDEGSLPQGRAKRPHPTPPGLQPGGDG